MASSSYMSGRIKWSRPQALLFSNNSGTLTTGGRYIPNGNEWDDFIILSDHNRAQISISNQRIETRNRMINGTMRSYHTADKISVQLSWSRLPSRAYSSTPSYADGELNQTKIFGGPDNLYRGKNPEEYTVDGGAGGANLLEWYESNTGPFWVYFSYDKLGTGNLNRYTYISQMYFASFDYEIEKRGNAWSGGTASGFDMWNISMSLEQV